MSAYLQQEFDFINRTKSIISQYSDCKLSEKFEVTLLLNCFVGLLILPQQHWLNDLPNDIINEKVWGIDPNTIKFIQDGETKSVANIVRHLRNSIAHYRFQAFKDDKFEISEINFQDFAGKDKSFEITISISKLNFFINKFSDFMLEKIKTAK